LCSPPSSHPLALHSFPTRRSSDLREPLLHGRVAFELLDFRHVLEREQRSFAAAGGLEMRCGQTDFEVAAAVFRVVPELDALRSRSEEHTSELQSLRHLVCRLLLEK